MANSGVLVYHCTKNEAEFAEVLSILGAKRKFKIGHLRLDVVLGDTSGMSVEEMAKRKGLTKEKKNFFFCALF